MKPASRPRILLASSERGSWIDRDETALAGFFPVTRLEISIRRLKLFQSFKALRHADVVFVWFGSLAAMPLILMARLLRRPVVLVAGGFDVANLPRFRHGAFQKKLPLRIVRRIIFALATRVLAVSESNRHEALANACIPAEKIELVPLGFEAPRNLSALPPWHDRKTQAVYLSSAQGSYYWIKGLDQLAEVAALCPDVHFVHLGALDEEARARLQSHALPNLELRGYVAFDSPEFQNVLKESKVVLQLSAYESFGAAVVDAALRGCMPLTSDAFALPELTRDIGTSVPYGRADLAAAELKRLLATPTDPAAIAATFLRRFAMSARTENLRRILSTIAAPGSGDGRG